MRVVQVAPTPVGVGGLFGGGERYPLELALALSRSHDVDYELVSFGAALGGRPRPAGWAMPAGRCSTA